MSRRWDGRNNWRDFMEAPTAKAFNKFLDACAKHEGTIKTVNLSEDIGSMVITITGKGKNA